MRGGCSMNNVKNFLLKTDRFCDYVPVVSSITNLVILFQKCIVLPLIDKTTIASNYHYKYINEKSFARCFWLVIPVIGNIIVGIYDFSKKKDDSNGAIEQVKNPIKTKQVDKSDTTNINLTDIDKVVVNGAGTESWPSRYQVTVTLKDGRHASATINNYDIYSIISKIPEESINPGQTWSGKNVKDDFRNLSKPNPNMGWILKPAEKVLNSLFTKNSHIRLLSKLDF